jgi:hypothetical protein
MFMENANVCPISRNALGRTRADDFASEPSPASPTAASHDQGQKAMGVARARVDTALEGVTLGPASVSAIGGRNRAEDAVGDGALGPTIRQGDSPTLLMAQSNVAGCEMTRWRSGRRRGSLGVRASTPVNIKRAEIDA